MSTARRVILAVLAVASLAALPATAGAAVTGNYSGKAVHPPFSFGSDNFEPYETSFVMTVLRDRVTAIYTRIRMECPETAILDRGFEHFPRKGVPLRNGNLHYAEGGLTISGHVGRSIASGDITGHVDGCATGSGGVDWKATKRL
jgi:hypothetical protein